MSDESFTKLFTANAIPWLFVVLIIFSVFCITLPKEEKSTPTVNETQVLSKAGTFTSPDPGSAAIDHEQAPLSLREKRAERLFHPFIMEAASQYRIDPALVKAIIMAESSYNPRAISKKGARGLMQLMPKTAAALGIEDAFNPEHNINGGVRYFRQLMNEFNNDVRLALAAYNAGTRKVRKYGDIPPFKSTQIYVRKVFEYYRFYRKAAAGRVGSA